ncbi:MAG: tetratricopeptide repeat protein [Treponema sp.]|jgi:tetratricopeptide (TPR) repeat protein|nr:tetratricopeptide repeat protein [Treponema sp.]
MYNRIQSAYRKHLRRKRLIVTAAGLVFIGLAVLASTRIAAKVREWAAKGDRRELLSLWDSGDYDEVFNMSQSMLDSRPTDYFLLTMNGFSAYQLGISQINSLNAQEYFDKCIWSLRKAMQDKKSDNDGRLYYVLGKAYSYKGENFADLTIKYLEKARELSDSTADIPEYLGMAYFAVEDYRSSVAAFSEALGTSAEGPSGPLLLSIARAYLALGEFENARPYLQRCIEVSPDFRTVFSARLLLAEALKMKGDIEGAIKQLQDIIAETGDDAEAHYQLGALYSLQGNTTRARAEWRLALRADPAHAKARARL